MSLRNLITSFLIGLASFTSAEVPKLLNHQGRMTVHGVPFQGTGQFKFALMSGDGTTPLWSNDGTGSPPAAAVPLPVSQGLYAVLLGDTSLTNMAVLPPEVFSHADVRLRVWFNDGANGFQQITPDQRLAAMPYALMASRVEQVLVGDVKAPPATPVLGWGRNNAGQSTMPAVLTGANTLAIAAGGSTSLALLRDGTVTQWGTGQAVPGGLAGVTAIACGVSHRLAVSGGVITAWGDNTYGQCTIPGGLSAVTAVACGERHSLALLAAGTVAVWGDNTFNQNVVPPGLSAVTAVAAGYDHCLALRSDGHVIAWGRNDSGQTEVPAGLDGVTAVAAGAYHSLAVKSDGTVVAWGWNTAGQCTPPPGLGSVSSLTAGYNFSIAKKSDGTLVAWGDNTLGQLNLPAEAAGLAAIAAGTSHVLGLRLDLLPAKLARLDQPNVFSERVGIKRTAAANSLEVEGNTSKTTAGNWLANSDRRIKTEIQPLTGALEKLEQVRLVDFRYTPEYLAAHPGIEDRRYLNVIAQEFARVFPEHVKGSGENLPDGSGILQVDTYPLTIYSAAAVQELHRENEALKQKLAGQEERLRKLEAALTK